MLLLSVFINVNVLLQKALLIEVFSKLINPQNDGHLDLLRVAIYYLSGSVVISHFGQSERVQSMREDK